MHSRLSVKVTYACKRRRGQSASKKSLSSPLEVLPLDMDDLTHTQMTRRMLKRSRRVAISEQSEDRNVEHVREHLAKRIKRNQERISDPEPFGMPFDMDDTTFRTPFPSVHSGHEPIVPRPPAPEQLSPVPAAKRIMSRTSSRNLKENSHTLASPFNSRPGSAASSPKHKGRGRPPRRPLGSSLHTKSRTLSGVFKENARRVSRKTSTISLKDANGEPRAKHIEHHRYPSSSSASYMRSQFAQEDWIVPLKALSHTLDGRDAILSPAGSVHSDVSFYAGEPQSCSTPAIFRLSKVPGLRGRETRIPELVSSVSSYLDHTELDRLDVEMIDGTALPRRQAIHLSENSIFSSSDEFTIKSSPAINNGATTVDKNDAVNPDSALVHAARPVVTHAAVGLHAAHPSTRLFIAEYDVPPSDVACSLVTPSTKALGPQKLSVGEQVFNLPGTSPAYGESLIRRCRKPTTLTPPASPSQSTAPCPPSSPASDLAHEFGSMDIGGDLDTLSDGETRRPFTSVSLTTRARSLQGAISLAEPTTKKSVKRMPTRRRAGTVRASDFVRPGPGASSSGGVSGPTISKLSNVRRTRSGTVVGPDSILAAKSVGIKGPATELAATQSVSESDDELLLRAAWMEDVEYLGLAVPLDKDADADELNLGGLQAVPPQLGLRRR